MQGPRAFAFEAGDSTNASKGSILAQTTHSPKFCRIPAGLF